MLLEQIKGRVRYSNRNKKYLKKLKPWDGGLWTKRDKDMINVKDKIKYILNYYQGNKCAYCGLSLGETSDGEIEHIAPKGRHPQFTFTPLNLALSCHLCNGPTKKFTKETISKLDINYRLCEYTIVHPYFDDPQEHFEWVANGRKVLISSRTLKGRKSIEIFHLDSTAHNEARAKKLLYEDEEKKDDEIEDQIKKILEFKGL
jgi:uncharacterized protein (TIGR02646 family)